MRNTSKKMSAISSLWNMSTCRFPIRAWRRLFYVVGLGCTRDPYLNVGLNNMWVNVGEQQFHLPTREAAGDRRLYRLGGAGSWTAGTPPSEAVADGLKGTQFSFATKLRSPVGYLSRGAIATVATPVTARVRRYDARACHMLSFRFDAAPWRRSCASIRRPSARRGRGRADAHGSFGRVKIGRAQVARFPRDGKTHRALRRPPYGHLRGEFFQSLWVSARAAGDLRRRAQPSVSLQRHRRSGDGEKANSLSNMKCAVLRHPMYHRPFVNRDPAQSPSALTTAAGMPLSRFSGEALSSGAQPSNLIASSHWRISPWQSAKIFLDILACPKCKGISISTRRSDGLVCDACRLMYPIKDDIPVMLIDEAVRL